MGNLNNILDCAEYDIPKAIVLCNENISVKDRVAYIPIYLMMFIHKEKSADVKFSIDFSGL